MSADDDDSLAVMVLRAWSEPELRVRLTLVRAHSETILYADSVDAVLDAIRTWLAQVWKQPPA